MSSAFDRRMMRLALREALRGRPSPNPYVGAAVVKDGELVTLGYHAKAGQAHAEVDAIRKAGDAIRGSTLYVTFEPCNHHGRTGPCTEAILAAGVRRVVIGCRDPHPHVPGAMERLQAAGLEVEVGVCQDEAELLVADFAKHISTGQPFVTAKAAITLDGRMATASGDSKWITSERARKEAHRLRDRSDAILVGVSTVLADDPELTVRLVEGRNPTRIVLDTTLRTPLDAKIVRTVDQAKTLIFHGPGVDPKRAAALSELGVELVEIPMSCGKVDLDVVLKNLGGRGVVRLLVEGGPKVLASLFARHHVDRVAAFVAPKLIGDASAPGLGSPHRALHMNEAVTLEKTRIKRLGPDVLFVGEIARRGAD